MAETKIGAAVRARLTEQWPEFCRLRGEVMAQTEAGRRLSERDVERVLEALVMGPLGWDVGQLAPQQDFADFALIDRGLKLAVVETKGFGVFRDQAQADGALVQGARYADRHRTPIIWGCDGCQLIFASRPAMGERIAVHLQVCLEAPEPPDELYYFTHYGLFRYPPQMVRAIPYNATQDQALYKRHHGVPLHYSCFAYVGDLRDKVTWIMPYRNADGSVDTGRIGHAVNFLLSPGGYRGQKAGSSRVPQAATLLCALRLARAYSETGRWRKPQNPFGGGKPDPQTLLWLYLHQHGIDEPGELGRVLMAAPPDQDLGDEEQASPTEIALEADEGAAPWRS